MMKHSRVAGLVFGILVWCVGPAVSGGEGEFVGKKAPGFTLMDCEGKELSLSQFAGKVIVLNFWRTTCFPCLEEMPDLQKIHEEYKDKGVVVLGLAVKDKMSDVDNKVNVMRITYPIMLDNMATRLMYKIQSVPHTFIIDKTGIIRTHFDKQVDKTSIEKAIAPLLAEQPAEVE